MGDSGWAERQEVMQMAVMGHAALDESFERPARSDDRSPYNIRTSYYPLRSGPRVVGILAIVVDHTSFIESETKILQQSILERRQHEQTMLEQEERLQLALRSGKLGTWQLSLVENKLIDASAICKESFGFSADEQFTYEDIVKTIHPDDLDSVIRSVNNSRKTGEEYHVEYRCIWRDGSEHWISATAQPTFDDVGRPVTLIGISQDISQRKIAEREKSELLGKIRDFSLIQASFLRDVLASVTDGKLRLCQSATNLPARGAPISGRIALTARQGLKELRQAAKSAALEQKFKDERWQDLVTAVSEAGMNAVVHAGGGEAQVFTAGKGCVQVWVSDKGKGIDLENLPRATLEKGYTTTGTMGHGMKMMLQTADRVWLLTGPGGTTLVIEQDQEALKKEWS